MDGGRPKRCGASWALVGLHLLSRPAMLELEGRREAILLGCAHLLGLLADRAQTRGEALEERARRAENELLQMKLVRAEDAKANEKVVAIFASHEQSWIAERKSLRLQIRALSTQLQTLRNTNEENVSDLNYRITEAECEIRAKEEAIEAEAKKREGLEEKLHSAEREVEELREEVRREEQDHFRELQRHKDALAELVANRGQLEEELARALEQAEATKQELDLVVEKMSDRTGRMQSDAEQKDKILSALLRKSKLDAAEKQTLLKEVKMARAKAKQAALEAEKWRSKWESRHKKVLRSSPYSVEAESSQERSEELQGKGNKNLVLDYFESEGKGENIIAAIKCLDQYSSEEMSGGELVTHDIQNLRGWVRMETEKYAAILEQKHFTEIEAFSEQMRLKDEKLEAFRWRLLSKDIESKRLQSQIEAHEENLTQLKEENLKLEALLVDREGEIKSLKEQFGFFIHHCQRNSLKHSSASSARESQAEIDSGLMKKENDEMERETGAHSERNSCNVTENEILKEATESTSVGTTEHYRDQMVNDIAAVNSPNSPTSTDSYVDSSIIGRSEISEEEEAKSVYSYEEQQSITLITNSPKQETEEEKEVPIDSVHAPSINNSKKDATAPQSITRKESSWKMDIHALGVSYKIKRLKQQLLVLEKLAGMKQITIGDNACDSPKGNEADDDKQHLKGIVLVIHLLNKQVKRFQSLEEKTDDLCRRMHESSGGGNRKEKSRVLGNFLEETFQLQRCMVATGQKLMDIQSKITGSISGSDGLDESVGFKMEQFADVIRTLFRDIQRGLEVRIARIIGDLEGTLACDGIRHI